MVVIDEMDIANHNRLTNVMIVSCFARTWSVEIDAVIVAAIQLIVLLAVVVKTTLIPLTLILCHTLLRLLVGSRANGCTYHGTASQTDESTYMFTTPTTADTANGRTQHRTERAAYIGTLTGVCTTAAQQQHATYYED